MPWYAIGRMDGLRRAPPILNLSVATIRYESMLRRFKLIALISIALIFLLWGV
jgi:hypothetical protein